MFFGARGIEHPKQQITAHDRILFVQYIAKGIVQLALYNRGGTPTNQATVEQEWLVPDRAEHNYSYMNKSEHARGHSKGINSVIHVCHVNSYS